MWPSTVTKPWDTSDLEEEHKTEHVGYFVTVTSNNGSWKEGDASAKQSLHGTSRSEVSRATSAKGQFDA
jgi:hypothetical protein